MQFGCFVQLEGLRKKWEGLVHISQVRERERESERDNLVLKLVFIYYKLEYHLLLLTFVYRYIFKETLIYNNTYETIALFSNS